MPSTLPAGTTASTDSTTVPAGFDTPVASDESSQVAATIQLQNTVVSMLSRLDDLEARMNGVETSPFVSPQLAYGFANSAL